MRKFLLFNFLLLPFLAFSDCEACGCCNVDEIGNMISNAVLSGCSSSCVKLSPEKCEQLKIDLAQEFTVVEQSNDNIASGVSAVQSSLEEIQSQSRNIRSQCNSILDRLNSYPDMPLLDLSSELQNLQYNLQRQVDFWINTLPSGGLYITNKNTNTSYYIKIVNNPRYFIPYQTNKLQQVQTKLTTYYSDLNTYSNQVEELRSEIRSSLDSVVEYCDGTDKSVSESFDSLESISSGTDSITDALFAMRSTLDTMNCTACGSGSSNDDSQCQTIDLTPIINAINELKERVDYWGNQLKNLMLHFYTDYDTIRKVPISNETSISYESYASQDNWFSRVEYLLYSLSDVSKDELQGDSDGKPDGADELESFASDSDSKAESEKSDLETKSQSMENTVTTSINRFVNGFKNNSIFAYRDISGDVILEYGGSRGFQLTIPSYYGGFAARMNKLFSVFWYVAGVLFFVFAFIGLVKLTVKFALWFLKLCSSSFG